MDSLPQEENSSPFSEIPASSWESWLEEHSVVRQWLLRLVATFTLIAVYRWIYPPQEGQFRIFGGSGKRVETHDEMKARSRLLDLHEVGDAKEKNSAAADENVSSLPTNDEPKESSKDTKDEKGDEQVWEVVQVTEAESSPELVEEDQPPTNNNMTATGRRVQAPSESQRAIATLKATTSEHPGLDQFDYWYQIEASLYRVYSVGNLAGDEIAPPFIPRSERGHVGLELQVTNNLLQDVIVYWVNYKGKEERKGQMNGRGGNFHVRTWIGHPWVFRYRESGKMILHYIPYRIIPSTTQMPTVDENDETVGIHRFSLNRNIHEVDNKACLIDDPVFPTTIKRTHDAAAFTFQHMSRMNYAYVDTCLKYLVNILLHPEETKYRKIRIANKKFEMEIWNTAARGLFLAAGFSEEGAYAELGCNETLPSERVQDLSSLVFYLEQWKQMEMNETEQQARRSQPEGADGSGRAGYGQMWGNNW